MKPEGNSKMIFNFPPATAGSSTSFIETSRMLYAPLESVQAPILR